MTSRPAASSKPPKYRLLAGGRHSGAIVPECLPPVVYETRFADGRTDQLPALATDLVRLKVDVIVTTTAPAVRAAMRATNCHSHRYRRRGRCSGARICHKPCKARWQCDR